MPVPTVAIACQGGGSHCAFGAGVLLGLLAACNADGELVAGNQRVRICGFSGTSGGAINALMGWYGLVHPEGPARAMEALRSFWNDTAAHDPWDAVVNAATVMGIRLRGMVPQLEAAPNLVSDAAQGRLRRQIEAQVDFPQIGHWLKAASPRLLIGAADVLSGEFVVFRGGPGEVPTVDQVLASTAVPELFRPVPVAIEGVERHFWDGLLSQNPPVRDFLAGVPAALTPDRIWVIRINPVSYSTVPAQLHDILDRRNEMAGNIALEQERFFVQHVNKWLARGLLPRERYRHVEFREIVLEEKSKPGDGLDYASKLDRSPTFIRRLMDRGVEAADRFLRGDARACGAP
jgi:NTE family protein